MMHTILYHPMNTDLQNARKFETALGTIAISASDAQNVIASVDAARAINTHRAYDSRMRSFRGWIESRGLILIDGVPVDAQIIALYLQSMYDARSKFATIRAHADAVSVWHTSQGMASPVRTQGIRDLLAGLRNKSSEAIKKGEQSRAPVQADAATADAITLMIRAIDRSDAPDAIKLRDRALLLLGFALGCRRSELAGLRMEHIKWDAQGIRVMLWATKTGDRQSQVCYDDNANMCAVVALRRWIDGASITDGAIFRQITITPRGARRAVIGGQISGQVVARTVSKYAAIAALPIGRWSGHSLRAGFCVQGTIDRVPESELRAQTGHKSSVFYSYAQRANDYSIRRNSNFGSR